MLHTSLTDPLTEPPITYPTRRLRGIFLQKNNSKRDYGLRPRCIPQSVVRSTAVVILTRLGTCLQQNGAGAVALRLSR